MTIKGSKVSRLRGGGRNCHLCRYFLDFLFPLGKCVVKKLLRLECVSFSKLPEYFLGDLCQ